MGERMFVKDPMIELLAIKLYEHDAQDGKWPPRPGWEMDSWSTLTELDRDLYRSMARGEAPYAHR